MKIQVNGTTLPVDPRFVPVCTLDANGLPVPLGSGGGGGMTGGATEAKQTEQLTQARQFTNSAMGFYGSQFVGDTTAHTGGYLGFVVVTDAILSALTLGPSSSGAAALVGVPLAAGQQVLAHITSITLASGVVQLIKAPVPFPAA